MNDVEQEKANTSRNDDCSQIDVNMFNDFICNTLKGYVDWKVAYSYVREVSFYMVGYIQHVMFIKIGGETCYILISMVSNQKKSV